MNVSGQSEIIAVIIILVGTIFSFLSTIGLIRLPDVYTRTHAASKSSTLGVLFTLIGTFLFFVFVEGYFSIRLFLGIFFIFLTAPVAAHMITRSAYRSNIALADISARDDLKEVLAKERRQPET